MSSPRPPRRVRWASLVAAVACSLLAFAAPVGADPLPLSDPPSATLACVDGVSVFTIHWPVGEYGTWDIGDQYLGDLSGPGGIFTVPTDESFAVPSGWSPNHSTVRLNRDTVGNTSYNQFHLDLDGAPCPFSTPVTATIDCGTRNLTASVPAGHVTQFAVYDQDGGVVYFRQYPRYNLFGVLVEDVHVGPATLAVPTPLPPTVTSVHVVLTVDNTELSTTVDTSCAPVEVRGGDGSAVRTTACDGTVTTASRPGTITVVRSGPAAFDATVALSYSGTLAATLAGDLPTTVHFDPGQHEVVIPVQSGAAGTLDVVVDPGAGYLLGAQAAARIGVTVRTSTDPCTEDPDPDPGTDGPTDRPPTSVPAPVAAPGPVADPGITPPAEVIAGTARLTG